MFEEKVEEMEEEKKEKEKVMFSEEIKIIINLN